VPDLLQGHGARPEPEAGAEAEAVVRLAPPLTVTADDVATALDALSRVVTLAA